MIHTRRRAVNDARTAVQAFAQRGNLHLLPHPIRRHGLPLLHIIGAPILADVSFSVTRGTVVAASSSALPCRIRLTG